LNRQKGGSFDCTQCNTQERLVQKKIERFSPP
jgi:hypothetical protein